MATMTSSSGISGLVSGIQWRDMIDQIMSLDTARQLTPVTDKVNKDQTSVGRVEELRTTSLARSATLPTSCAKDAFGAFAVTAGNSRSTGNSLLSATATAGQSRRPTRSRSRTSLAPKTRCHSRRGRGALRSAFRRCSRWW